MRERLPAIALALLLVGLLFLIASGAFEQVVIVPLLFLWWVARVLYESIPQALLWGIFVAIAVPLIAKSLAWRAAPLPTAVPQAGTRGHVADWSRWLRDSSRDDHARWQLAQRLSQLAVEALALREQCSPQEINRRLQNGSLDLPPDLRAYLRAGLSLYAPRSKPRSKGIARNWLFGRLQRPARASRDGMRPSDRVVPRAPAAHTNPLDVDPALLIEYLEHTLQLAIGEA